MQILIAQINPTVGDFPGNTEKILKGIQKAKKSSAEMVVFPELALSGYPPDDLLLLPQFIEELSPYLEEIIAASEGLSVLVGLPRRNGNEKEKPLYNSVAVIEDGKLLGFQDKILLPTYDVFDERRYFEPGKKMETWTLCKKQVAITICEDIWQNLEESYQRYPVEELVDQKPDLLINIAASPFRQLRFHDRLLVCQTPAKKLHCPVVLCNQVGGNDSLIFDGYSLHVDASGELQSYAKGFQEDYFFVDTKEKGLSLVWELDPSEEIFSALSLGLCDYFKKLGFKKACLGLSGGIDSAVVASIATHALGKENVLGVLMPSRFSSEGSLTDSLALAENLGIETKTIPIETAFEAHLKTLDPLFNGHPFDVTEENLQARIRGTLLMALSNKFGHIVLSTGNKSELAMGYVTLYGDTAGGLSILNDVTKGQVYKLADWINRNQEIIPQSTIEKPPSAELKANQCDADTLPDYQIIDHVVEGYIERHHSPEQIAKNKGIALPVVQELVARIHQNEYKRRQSPPGLRISTKAFSVGRRFPIVHRWT